MKKKIALSVTLMVIAITLIGILGGLYLFDTAVYGLVLGVVTLLLVGRISGNGWHELFVMIKNGVKKSYIVLIIMSLVGMLSAIWMKSGTIPSLMLFGFEYLLGMNFLLAAFLITGLISMLLGTAIGTISTIGIPLFEIGSVIGIPPAVIAGAIISGAYIGDRTSPLSSVANLIAIITETKLIPMLKHFAKTLFPALIICFILYLLIGRPYLIQGDSLGEINNIMDTLHSHFQLGWYSLLPALLIIVMAVSRIHIVYCMLAGLVSSIFITVLTQEISFIGLLNVLVHGYHPAEIEVGKLLSGGGLLSMTNVILTITASTALNGLLESMGMLEPLLEKFFNGTKRAGDLILKTAILSAGISATTCNQSLAIIIPGSALRKRYLEKGLHQKELARAIADSGIAVSPLIPWNINAVAITSMLGVSALDFSPYAFLCFLLPLITITCGYCSNRNDVIATERVHIGLEKEHKSKES
ncbi:MAG: hypothetical protein LR001_07925 [Clostridiales bacterium]|nr:hypothetical protein [Clostridiales bacterium]